MRSKIIGIDVDETVVHVKDKWRNYAKQKYNIDLDFSKEISDPLVLDFWRRPNLYDDLAPIKNTDKYINELYKKYKIVFISDCFDEHVCSKYKFLRKYFKYDAFINTSDKSIINLDVIIDDRPKFLTSDNHSLKIQVKSELPKLQGVLYMDWGEIYDFLIDDNIYI